MATGFSIHDTHPQQRLIDRLVELLKTGGIAAYPTDASYAIGCLYSDSNAVERLRQIRRLSDKHPISLLCEDVSQLSNYAKIDNRAFRLIRALTPGPYTFLLDATREVPRKLHQKNKKTIGLRIPDHPITRAIIHTLGVPLASTTCTLPDESDPLIDPLDIDERLGKKLDAVVFGGLGHIEQTTIIDLTQGHAEIIRHGLGDTSEIE